MTDLFQNVLTASFHGSIVILAVLVLRFALKKTPKKFLCLLWMLAGIRLLMPFQIRSGLSLQPDVEAVTERPAPTVAYEEPAWEELPEAAVPVAPEADNRMPVVMMPAGPMMPDAMPEELPEQMMPAADPLMTLDAIAANIWAFVAIGFAIYTLGSYLRLKLQVREAVRIKGNIWECDRIETAFILGFIRPQIYLPMGMSQNNRRHILAHERTHLEKGDHWFKMIGYIALAIHWFNPLVWVAYILLCKDIEMACDERVVQFMELEERKSYSAALINCSTNHAHFAACPVAFGEVSVKNRVLSVLNYKKPSFWISLAGVVAIIFVAVCLVTSPTEEAEVIPETTVETEPPREVVNVSTVDELLSAIGSDREIVLEAGAYNLCEASTYGGESGSDYFVWQQVSDGYQLSLIGVDNLAIRGSGMHVTLIETDPRFADVIALQSCTNVELSGFTAGHTRYRGECGGGVVNLTECNAIDLSQLGLYGCGVVGLETESCSDITVTDCDIYECSSSAANLRNTDGVTFSRCRVYNMGTEPYGAYTYFEAQSCRNVVIENCELSDSTVANLLCAFSSDVVLKNNLISGNRFTSSVMNIQGMEIPADVTLENNKFEDNTIRSWYEFFTSPAHDEKGKPLTEDILMEQYGIEPTEPQEPQLEIHVSTVDEFIAAIGPNKDIVLDAELYDFSTATGYGTSKGDYYFWEDVFDGPGLVIQNVSNMTIRSSDGNVKGHTLAAIPRYADVLAFRACDNITVSGITAGHTKEQGSCAGGVLEFRDCDIITVDNCGLFGCGILGVQTESCSDVTVKNCEIYECSEGGIKMWDTSDVTIKNTTFRDIAGRNIMMFSGCKSVKLDGEELIPATGGSKEIKTPEQEELHNLELVVMDFVCQFRDGRAEDMAQYLAKSYTGDGKAYENPHDSIMDSSFADVTVEHVKQIREQGSAAFAVKIREWDKEESNDIGILSYTIIKENGAYKVSDYILEQNEA